LGQGGPLVGLAAGVHENHAAAGFGADCTQVGIPEKAADIVDDFGSGGEGGVCCGGFVGVYAEDGLRAGFEDSLEDGEEAGLFFVGG